MLRSIAGSERAEMSFICYDLSRMRWRLCFYSSMRLSKRLVNCCASGISSKLLLEEFVLLRYDLGGCAGGVKSSFWSARMNVTCFDDY